MTPLNISFQQAPNRMSPEAKEGRHFKVSERCSRCRAISFFRAKQSIAVGFMLLVFQPLLMEMANSSTPLHPVAECSCASPLNPRYRWRGILGSFKTSSRKSKIARSQQEVSPSPPLEITQAKPPGVPHSDYPKRCQAGWDCSSSQCNLEKTEAVVSSAGTDEEESNHVKKGRIIRVASNLIRRASARAHSFERNIPFKRDKAPNGTQSLLDRKRNFRLSSPTELSEGKGDLSEGECEPNVSSTDRSTSGRGGMTTRSARRPPYRRNAWSLTDSSIFDQVRQEERISDKQKQENKGFSTRLLDTGLSSNSSNSLAMLTGLTEESTIKDDVPPEADSAVESGADTYSSASSVEKNAGPTETDEEGTAGSQTQEHGKTQSPTTQEKARQPWYLTIRMDTAAVSFSKHESETEPSVPHIKMVLLRESDLQTSSSEALLPLKLRLPQKSYICFTLNTVPLLLENADMQETEAIIHALGKTKEHVLSSAMRLSDATNKPIDPNAIWCVVLDGGDTDKTSYSTYILLSDEEVEQG